MTDRVPWVYAAAGDVSERLDFLTDVLRAKTGPEQTRRLRYAPRVFQQFDTQETAQVRRLMETDLALNGAGLWDVPLVQEACPLLAEVEGGVDTALAGDFRWCRFVEGGRVLIMGDDPQVFDVCEVATVGDDTLTLVDPPANDWPTGTWAMPLFEGMLDTQPNLGRFTGNHGLAQITFRLTEPVDVEQDAGSAVYRTLPVFEIRPDWSQDPETTHDRDLLYEDNDIGTPIAFDLPGQALVLHVVQTSTQGRQATWELRQLLYAFGGRWAAFWAPSQAADFLVVANLVAASATLDVEFTGMSGYALPTWRRDIRIELEDGTILYRRITAVADIGANKERLTLDSALGVNRTAAQVALVSFLAPCQQDADTNLLKFWKGSTSGLAQCEMRFRGIVDDDL